MNDLLKSCHCCPRQCGVNRLIGESGFCHSDDKIRIGSICVHYGEEPVFGLDGMVNVFFTHCNLRCSFCQNFQISHGIKPEIEYELTLNKVVEEIESRLSPTRKCVGFVSPSHVIPQMHKIIKALKDKHPEVIIVMNSNGYDSEQLLKRLSNDINVYLPDLKYLDNQLAQAYSQAVDYPEVAKKAIKEMVKQKGADLILDENGVIKSGLIIRHLVLPGQLENTRACLNFIAKECSNDIYCSIMAQYTPTRNTNHEPCLSRSITEEEYNQVLDMLDEFNLDNGWIQSFESIGYYSPDFKKDHPFTNIT